MAAHGGSRRVVPWRRYALRARGVTCLFVAVAALVGCSGGAAPPREPGVIAPELLQPLTGLGPCSTPEATSVPQAADVAGLLLPDGAIAASVLVQEPLTNVQGYMTLTPIQVRAFYLDHDAVEVIVSEDEVWESETLVSDGEHRLFVKAQAVCEQGSLFVAVVGTEAAAEFVPAPAGSPSPLPGAATTAPR